MGQLSVCCVCVSGNQPVECVQIMRRWSSNLGQGPLKSLGSVTNCYILVYLTHPFLYSQFIIYFFGRGSPLLPQKPYH